jgi:methylmalonyl-CoA mutase N-terminal domain/subunit
MSTEAPAGRDELLERVQAWRETTLARGLAKLKSSEPPERFDVHTPLDVRGHNYLRDVSLPGEFPFTSWLYPTPTPFLGEMTQRRAGRYSGFGTSTDVRDQLREAARTGKPGGPNIASDLPSQLGWDSDDPRAVGEVGRVGVAVDSIEDFENIYEVFVRDGRLGKISTNWTINAPAAVYVALYCALAIRHGVPLDSLVCTPQNDILKEYCARGLYIFPPRESLRVTRDMIGFMTTRMPRANTISICAEHIRYAGASTTDSLAFAFANAIEYVNQGLATGLEVDEFLPRFTFRGFGDSSMDFFRGVAAPRAARRIWARLVRDRFDAKNERSCLLRGGEHAWGNAYLRLSRARPIANIVRETVEAMIQGTASGQLTGSFPFDEALRLGHSPEALQVRRDLERILYHEAKIGQYVDPFAGSYLIESLTDEIEQEILDELAVVEDMGGAVAAVETGYYRHKIAEHAWELQRRLETGEDVWVGVSQYTGPEEIDVQVTLTPEYPPDQVESAEARQIAALAERRRHRDLSRLSATLRDLEAVLATDDNIMPALIECALAGATVGEMCDVMCNVLGTADTTMDQQWT